MNEEISNIVERRVTEVDIGSELWIKHKDGSDKFRICLGGDREVQIDQEHWLMLQIWVSERMEPIWTKSREEVRR